MTNDARMDAMEAMILRMRITIKTAHTAYGRLFDIYYKFWDTSR